MLEEIPEEDGLEENEFAVVDLNAEWYLVGRDDSVHTFTTYKILKKHLDEGQEVKDFMNIVLLHLIHDINDQNSPFVVLSDSRHNKRVIVKSEIQAVSLLAPDAQTILEA